MPLLSTRTLSLASLLAVYAYAQSGPTNASAIPSIYKDNSPQCDCYQVNSNGDELYFTNHRWYDFRNLASNTNDYTQAPPFSPSSHGAAGSKTPDSYLNSTDWNNDWGVMDWGRNGTGVYMQNSHENIFITQTNSTDLGSSNKSDTTYLTLRTARLPSYQTAAEVENEIKNLWYASVRMRARIVGDRGAVGGFFTYFDDNNESDIEILTYDNTSTWRMSDQPSVNSKGDAIPQSLITPTNLPPWNEWQEFRIDWSEGQVRWYVNSDFVCRNTYSVPRKPSGLVLNSWSDGGTWSGNMSVGGQAEMQVQWIQMVFNTSGSRDGTSGGNKRRSLPLLDFKKRGSPAHCQTFCQVDGVNVTGYPQTAYIAKSAASSLSGTVMTWSGVAMASMVVLFSCL